MQRPQVREFVQRFNRTDLEPLSLFSTEFTQLYPDLEPDTRPIADYLAAVREASHGVFVVPLKVPAARIGLHTNFVQLTSLVLVLVGDCTGLLGASVDSLPSFHLGGPGAGAPLHWHEFALNVQMFGMKRWILYVVVRCSCFRVHSGSPDDDRSHSLTFVVTPWQSEWVDDALAKL